MGPPACSVERILEALNASQREAVLHERGPLLVLAGAGSGKTRVIMHRIAMLLARGCPPDGILAITFTNKAADEMKARAETLCGMRSPWISTFHSFCARILRRHIHRLPPYDSSFTIYDADDSRSLIKAVIEELSIDQHLWSPRAAQARVSRIKNGGREPAFAPSSERLLAGLRERTIGEIYLRYVESLRERNAVDFDDLLLLTVRLFEEAPDILEEYRGQFRHVLIDEYQDTNGVQYRIGKMLTETHRNICITGDPDQSIYSWRGADINNILNFERDYPDARIVTLERNYRSTGNILRVANSLISHNEKRLPKSLWTDTTSGEPVRVYRFSDEREEAKEIADLVQRTVSEGTPPGDVAIFYRINALSRALEQELIYANVPYSIVGGIEFFLRAEVKDIISYLRVLANPRDAESTKRILNVPPRGIGKSSLARILDGAREAGRGLLPTIIDGAEELSLSKRAASGLEGFAALYRRLRDVCDGPVADTVRAIIEETRFAEHLRESGADSAKEKVENIWELHHAAKEYDETFPGGGIAGFLERVNLLGDVDRWRRSEDRVALMTLHSAKGLEFPVVVILGAEDGILPLHSPSDSEEADDLEEERRLLYVGITRARRLLYITHTASRMRYGRTRYSMPSPLLRELSGGGGGAGGGSSAGAGSGSGANDSAGSGSSAGGRAGAGGGTDAAAASLEVDDGTLRSLFAPGEEELDSAWGDASEVSIRFEDKAGIADRFPDDWPEDGEDPFAVGTKVYHEEYGAGEVTRVSGVGPRRRITVAFDDCEEKQFVAGFSPLRRIR